MSRITLSRCLPLILLIAGLRDTAIGGTTPEDLVAGTGARIDQVFQAEAGKPYTLAKVYHSLAGGRPYYSRYYSWSVVGYAARCFYLNQSLAAANARLQQNARYYLRELTSADKAEILPAEVELNTNTYARIVDRDSFHWHADMVLRLIEMYGANGSVAPGRMDAATEAKCLEPIWHYVRLVSRLAKAEYLQSKTWHLWESENHHAMSFPIAWHFSKIAKDLPTYQNRTYNDGSTPAGLYAAWNAYFVEYVRERFRKGIFVEMMNEGYNGETIRGLYNFHDFGDPQVKEHAGMLLDLFWAYWSEEQFNGVSGGGKARLYFDSAYYAKYGGVVGNMAWLYFGIGLKPKVEGVSVNALLSSYRPPAVVADIAVDVIGRGTYEVRQAAQGLGGGAQTSWDQSQILRPYSLNTNGGGIQRYSYCAPAFIMGTPMADARSDYVAISSQNRWQGVIFRGAGGNARIVPIPLPNDERVANNQFWTVQSKGSMITQMYNSQNVSQMWAWISKSGLTDPVEENGIFFVQTDAADGAYAAIRVVGTGYTLIENYDFGRFTPPDHWIVQLNDKLKPLIIEVMAKDRVAGFAAFKTLVKSNTPSFVNNLVTHKTIYGDVLTLDASYAKDPTINGVPVDYTPDKSYDSPFLYGDYNGDTFVIKKGSRQKVCHFASPLSVANLSPADGSANVATDTDLIVTFNQEISAASGLIAIKNLTDGTQIAIDITDGTQVSISGTSLTINPNNDLLNGKAYAIQIPPGAIEGSAGDAFAGISDDTTWNFATVAPDATAPVIGTKDPADDSTDVSILTPIVATFDENLVLGSGNITIYNVTLGSVAQTIDVNDDSQVTLAGNVLTINPASALDVSTEYAVQMDAGVVRNLNDLPNAAIADMTSWSFTTHAVAAYTWIQGGNVQDWNDPLNWLGGAVPPQTTASTVLAFSSATSGAISSVPSAKDTNKVTVGTVTSMSTMQPTRRWARAR